MHFEYIAQAVSTGIMQVSLESYVPCIFGVLTVLNTGMLCGHFLQPTFFFLIPPC
jgi:6,7-dimethyl-8-ribityllumazine synthase